jgi:chemotaxis protein MotB
MKLAMLALVAFLAVGCVAQREVDNQRTLYRRAQEQIADLQARLEEAQARIAALQARGGQTDPDMEARLAKALADRDAMRKSLEEAMAKLSSAGGMGPISVLDVGTSSELRELVSQFPDLMEFDEQRGMIRFKSDMTFALGSTEVRPQAREALKRLAQVLERGEAQKYEARIVGHTDNVRIGRADTRAKHPTNWHLSVHRAIAVKDVLEGAGVPPARMQVAGYGEYHPIVPNAARGGAERNRRVEIYLVPATYTGLSEAAPAEREEAPAPPAPAPRATEPVEDVPLK